MVKSNKKIEPKKRIKISKRRKKDTFSTLEVIIIVVLSLILGFVLAMIFMFAKDKYIDKTSDGVNEIIDTYNSILDEYYDEVNSDDLVEAAVSAMVNSLNDPHSYYMDKETSKEFNESLNGSYEGIGLMITRQDQDVEVVKVVKDSPAEKAGFESGDILLEINGTSTNELAVSQIADKIKESKDIKIKYRRGDKETTVDLKKATIETESVTSEIYDSNIGYIRITTFATNTAKQFEKNLNKLEKKGIKSLIIDVRGNPGGHLEQADLILSKFFKKGTVLYQITEKKGSSKVLDKTKESRNYPVTVIINEYSASASEIVASCFQENYKKAKIVGIQSFGKGTIQNEVLLKNGGSYKYTMKKWLSSKGIWYDRDSKGGIIPDVQCVLNDGTETGDNVDQQLDKAREILKEE